MPLMVTLQRFEALTELCALLKVIYFQFPLESVICMNELCEKKFQWANVGQLLLVKISFNPFHSKRFFVNGTQI